MTDKEQLWKQIREGGNRWYVYILRRPDGAPFYVGKGKGERIFRHERDAKNTVIKSHRLNTIRKIWREGKEVVKEIHSWHDAEDDACNCEVQLIARYGRQDLGTGILVNQTPGGEQGIGNIGPEARLRLAESIRRTLANPAVRQKMSEASKRRLADPAVRLAIGTAVKRWIENNPDRVKQSNARRAATLGSVYHRLRNKKVTTERFQQQGERERQSERLKRFYDENPNVLVQMAERTRQRVADPAVREHLAESRRKWNRDNPEAFADNERRRLEGLQRPEVRVKQSEAKKRLHLANPELRVKMLEATRTPEAKAKHAESQRLRFQNPDEKARMKALAAAGKARRNEVRLRALALLEKHGLIAPSGHASMQEWSAFEKKILDLVGEPVIAEGHRAKIRLKPGFKIALRASRGF